MPSAVSAAPNPLAAQLLAAHNLERQSVGLVPIVWDPALAAAADAYAVQLARTGAWGHSPPQTRVDQGENLWMGTHGAFSVYAMMAGWTGEKRMFRPGIFPNVARRGSWHDVGHYTQIIWPATKRVGCSVRSSARNDYLVCRYSVAGNVIGQPVGARQLAGR
ncbi:MAG: CAP domain-containing protein [Sphingomicrobium sp.]